MSHRTAATVVLDSITSYGDATRLTSMYVVFPKMVLGERNRHRAFSLSDRSSRAVPPEKLIEEVRIDPAVPAKFRGRVKGMGGGEDFTDEIYSIPWRTVYSGPLADYERWGDEPNTVYTTPLNAAQRLWARNARSAAADAEAMAKIGLAKEIANRPLDPFIRMHSLMTATTAGWMNFFGLRLDAAADPTIQVLAQRCWDAYRSSTPKLLQLGEWHLPFVDADDDDALAEEHHRQFANPSHPRNDSMTDLRKYLSAARCAHLSYDDLETGKRMTIDRALRIYDKLVTSRPIHASPTEHQATPDEAVDSSYDMYPAKPDAIYWRNRNQHGNFFGWRQARKMISGEEVADLPEGYTL